MMLANIAKLCSMVPATTVRSSTATSAAQVSDVGSGSVVSVTRLRSAFVSQPHESNARFSPDVRLPEAGAGDAGLVQDLQDDRHQQDVDVGFYALLGALAGLLAPSALFLFAAVSKRELDPFWLSVLLAVGGMIVFAVLGE